MSKPIYADQSRRAEEAAKDADIEDMAITMAQHKDRPGESTYLISADSDWMKVARRLYEAGYRRSAEPSSQYMFGQHKRLVAASRAGAALIGPEGETP
jgi:hypothetical protein